MRDVGRDQIQASGNAKQNEGMQHDWPLTLPWLDESNEAWRSDGSVRR